MSQESQTDGKAKAGEETSAQDGSEFTIPDPADEQGASQGPDDVNAGDESSGGSLPPSAELEEALRAATEAVEARESEREVGEAKPAEWAVLEEELAALREQHDTLEKQHLRLQADFDNVRRRAMKDRQESLNYGHEGFAKDLLGTVDNLERAIEHAKVNSDAANDLEGMLRGVELVRRELLQVLERYHVTPVEALGEVFDPALHEAMAQRESDEVPPNTVVQVFAKGYLLRDRLLRPAKVIVSKAGAAGTGSNDSSAG